jgi:hypothetical protein
MPKRRRWQYDRIRSAATAGMPRAKRRIAAVGAY